MKVQDIRSFFKSPGDNRNNSTSGDSPSNVVQVPSKLSRGRRPAAPTTSSTVRESPSSPSKSKSGKKSKRTSLLDEDEDDEESPLPKAVKKPKTNGTTPTETKKGDRKDHDKGKRKHDVVEIDDDDEDDDESPIPKAKPSSSKQVKEQASKSKHHDLKKPSTSKGATASTSDKQKSVKEDVRPEKKRAKTPERKVSESPSTRKSPRIQAQNTPDSSKKKTQPNQQHRTPSSAKISKIEKSKRKLNLDEDDDEEAPIPKRTASSSRKARPLIVSDSDESDQEILTATPPVLLTNIKKKAEPKPSKLAQAPPKKSSGTEFKEPKKASTSDEKPIPTVPQTTPKSKGQSKGAGSKGSPENKPVDVRTPEEKKAAQKSNFFKLMSRAPPKHLGAKEVPVGADGCLNGLTFVQTGVLDSFEKDDIKAVIEKYGGRVTGSVSRKTSYLLMGDEPGESKRKKAKELGVPIMSEDELLEMIRKSNPDGQPQSQTVFGIEDDDEDMPEVEEKVKIEKVESPKKEPKPSTSENRVTEPKIKTEPKKSPEKASRSTKPDSKKSEIKAESQESTSSSVQTASSSIRSFSSIASTEPAFFEETWVEKYRPKTLRNLVGQTGDRSNANKLLRWVKNWFLFHGKSDDKAKANYPGLKDPEGKFFKAALLSGPPGIGKTTMAHLVCKEVGLDYIELNASDTRNKKGLHEILSDLLSSKSLNDVQSKSRNINQLARHHVLIMDEVDGMSGNEDRGGIQELIALIKTSRIPIICICNDRNHQKIRSLANYCFDLRCNKPTIEQLKGFIQSICFKEKMKVPYDSIMKMVKSTDFDIRQIINQLQLLKETDPDNQTVYNPRKDIVLGPWDVVRKVFSASEHVGMSLQDKNNLFFQDYSFGPLFVQENYTKWEPVKAKGNVYKTLDLVRDAAESIATGDLVESLLRRTNNWSLLPTQAIFASILPGEIMEGHLRDSIDFPRWLGKNSNRNKVSRILQQLHTHVHLHVSGSLEALNMDYLPYLRRSIFNPLVAGDVDESAQVMQDYDLLREDLDNINELTFWPGMKNPMERIDPKTKAAFTRQVNKEILPYAIGKVTKGKGKGKAGDEEELEGLEDEEAAAGVAVAADEEEEETLDMDAMIKKKTARSKGGAAKASTSQAAKKGSTSGKSKNKPKPRGGSKRSRDESDDDEDLNRYESDFIDDSDDDEDLVVTKKSSSSGSKTKKSRK